MAALGVGPDVDLRPEAVTIQPHGPSTRRALLFALKAQQRAADLEVEAEVNRAQTISLLIAHARGVGVRPFWAAALGYKPVGDRGADEPVRRGAVPRVPTSRAL